MRIVFFQRKPFQDFVSIEHIYDMVRKHLPQDIDVTTHISRFHSKGILKRIYNVFEAAFYQSDVNHVTGDVNFLVFLLNRNRTILSIHGTFNPNPNLIIQKILELIWWRLPLKKVKYITVVSQALKQEIIQRFDCEATKIKVIYNPVNTIFQAKPKSFPTKPVLLQVGTKPAKNVERLIIALDGIDCYLHLIGVLSETQKALLKKHKIEFSNQVGLSVVEMKRAYENCDILTFVSVYEGFGMPIIEANTIGRVVLTGNIAAMPEVANDAALMVNPLDIEAIRKGILKLINDKNYRNQLIENGFENAKRFDVKVVTGQYYSLYKEVYSNFET
jgi:glycosyltransferase involved in cell wall biosynthesis